MLEQLPYPKNLRNVPEFAGGHHEKMDGTGYPKGLNKSQMSTQARIMAIADIYEALTAADRPYKEGKKLSQAMRIMGFMKNDYHIDEDLFEIFVTSGAISAGKFDFIPKLINKLGFKTYFKGVLIKPGRPIMLSKFKRKEKLFFGLPGNPISCAAGFRFFIYPLIRKCLGM